ncbi:MAG: amidohydrolase family protein [Proteobacteria bacterium]|nr:amidohydrolase family protein [Pseudomonadota bacterium]MBU1710501.1 amidohydrolase family protein [Pseudomonadota bacterium]
MKVLYRAQWLATMADHKPLIENGGVVCENGLIIAAGEVADLAVYDKVIECDGILTPGLINAHVHLELSHLAELGWEDDTRKRFADIVEWIRKLISIRNLEWSEDVIKTASCQAAAALYDSGCIAAADIGNLLESYLYACNARTDTRFFLELIGLSREAQEKAFQQMYALTDEINCTAHAPYSASPELIIGLKKRAIARRHIYPIHVAESLEETEFLNDGSGSIRRFLEDVGAWDGTFVPPGCSPVRYLEKLGILDKGTLCVHGVQVGQQEIEILAKYQTRVCLCPASNRYLGVGKAPATKYIDAGILPALGTDSLASNQELSIWREMRMLKEDHSGLDPQIIFAMATQGGAYSMGLDRIYGSLEAGKNAALLCVQSPGLRRHDVFEFLVSAAETAQVKWLEGRTAP